MMRIFPFPPGIKFTHPYHNYYGSSFYRFMQLELLICTSTSIFKHFLYTNMPYICNAKIGYNFITLSFQHTQLQHFALKSRSNARGIQLVIILFSCLLTEYSCSCGLFLLNFMEYGDTLSDNISQATYIIE